jgi:hypothetical protein
MKHGDRRGGGRREGVSGRRLVGVDMGNGIVGELESWRVGVGVGCCLSAQA